MMLYRSICAILFGLAACQGEIQDIGTSGPGSPPSGPPGLLPGEFGGVPTTDPTTGPDPSSTADEPARPSTRRAGACRRPTAAPADDSALEVVRPQTGGGPPAGQSQLPHCGPPGAVLAQVCAELGHGAVKSVIATLGQALQLRETPVLAATFLPLAIQ